MGEVKFTETRNSLKYLHVVCIVRQKQLRGGQLSSNFLPTSARNGRNNLKKRAKPPTLPKGNETDETKRIEMIKVSETC